MRKLQVIRKAGMVVMLLCVLGVMTGIFLFSAQNGIQSSALSSGVARRILRFLGIATTDRAFAVWHVAVRKLAHVTVYALLGATSYMALRLAKRRFPQWIALLMSIVYAALDELHQASVTGRGPGLRDVGFDTLGAGMGILAAVCIFGLIRKIVYALCMRAHTFDASDGRSRYAGNRGNL